MIEYHPKGSMCAVCKYRNEMCDNLPFHTMHKIGEYKTGDTTHRVVRCDLFKRDIQEAVSE